MMAGTFGRDWWPDGMQAPIARLATGLAAAPLIVAAAATLAAFLFAGSSLSTSQEVQAATINAGLTAVSAFSTYAFTFGLAAVLLLWGLRIRGMLGFFAGGAASGMLFAGFTMLIFDAPPNWTLPLILTGAGALILLLVRWIAGVRNG